LKIIQQEAAKYVSAEVSHGYKDDFLPFIASGFSERQLSLLAFGFQLPTSNFQLLSYCPR
jgi:hypothetical protein